MMITVEISESMNKQKKELGMTWRGVLKLGLESHERIANYSILMSEFEKLKEKHLRTVDLLQNAVRTGTPFGTNREE